MTKIINIKDVKLNDYILFQEHNHIVFEDQLDCSNLYGKVIEIKTLDIIEGKTSISIKVQLDSMKYKEILEEYDNCLYFNFPHDEDHYDDTKVVIIKSYKILRTETVTDYQIVKASSEDEAYDNLKDDKWEGYEVQSSDTDIEEQNKPQLKTFITHVPVHGSMRVSVEASSEKEALELIKDGKYTDNDDSFSLQDCETTPEDLTEKDIEELC